MATPFLDLGINTDQQLESGTQREWAAHALRLGWDGVAMSAPAFATGPLREQHRCTIQPVDLPSLLSAAKGVREALQAAQQRTPMRHGNPYTFCQFSRLNIVADEPAAVQAACSSSAVISSYDIIAIQPQTERIFQQACTSLPVDIISLDLSKRMPFRPKPAALQAAMARGIHFEITYGPALHDLASRRQLFANVQVLCRGTRGRNIVLCSGARSFMDLRGPHDVANLGTLFGLTQKQAAAAVGRNAEAVLQHARERRAWKGVLACVRPRQQHQQQQQPALPPPHQQNQAREEQQRQQQQHQVSMPPQQQEQECQQQQAQESHQQHRQQQQPEQPTLPQQGQEQEEYFFSATGGIKRSAPG